MTVSSIRERNFKNDDYTAEEIAAMKRDESSGNTLNKVRHDAGIKGDVTVRGDDKSSGELRKEWEGHDYGDATISAVRDVIIEGTEGTILHATGPLFFGYEALKTLNEAKEHGEALAESRERGAMHLAMLTSIDVPQCYKNEELSRWKDAGVGESSGATRMGVALSTIDKKEAALLQLHADRGMTAARGLIETGGITREASDGSDVKRALTANPSLRAKYESDVAFRAGFDALVSAKKHDTAAYEKAIGNLEARDARYHQHAISVRG
jgi:hypothetical protein